jgi:hypothetical protein
MSAIFEDTLRDFMVAHRGCDLCGETSEVIYGEASSGRMLARCPKHASPIKRPVSLGYEAQEGDKLPPGVVGMMRPQLSYEAVAWPLVDIRTFDSKGLVTTAVERHLAEGIRCAACDVVLTHANVCAFVMLTPQPHGVPNFVLQCRECHDHTDESTVDLMADRLARSEWGAYRYLLDLPEFREAFAGEDTPHCYIPHPDTPGLQDDRDWFAAHPKRRIRIRHTVPDDGTLSAVWRIQSARARRPSGVLSQESIDELLAASEAGDAEVQAFFEPDFIYGLVD